MFTGIIRTIGTVQKITKKNGIMTITVKNPLLQRMAIGDSVAIDGVCLTITQKNKNTATFDIIPETQRITTLATLQPNAKVHLEKPLAFGKGIHGHILLGHIDCMAKITEINQRTLTISTPLAIQKRIIQKGSIGINGVSLTVAKIKKNACTVALTPETLRKTTFKTKKRGDPVNIEIDLPQRYSAALRKKTTNIGIVAGEFNKMIVEKLVAGACKGLKDKGAKTPTIVWVPGAFEIPLTAKKMALTQKYDAIIALGLVLKGETAHYEHVCRETAHGIAQAALETGVPIIFEVLMCDTIKKALARSADDIKNNKGYHAAAAAILMIDTFKNL